MKKLVILRSAPGGGKSTYARRIQSKLKGLFGISSVICSADNYFVRDGVYTYDRDKIGKAHEECRELARKAMEDLVPVVIIDNTNIARDYFKAYIEFAKWFGYKVIERVIGLDLDVDTLVKRNIHNVPRHTIESMVKRLKDSTRLS